MNCDLKTTDYNLMMFNAGFCNLYEYSSDLADSQKNHIATVFCASLLFFNFRGSFFGLTLINMVTEGQCKSLKKSPFHILRCKNAFATKIQHMQVYVEEENSNEKLLSFKG